jgi:hypothetical protein
MDPINYLRYKFYLIEFSIFDLFHYMHFKQSVYK